MARSAASSNEPTMKPVKKQTTKLLQRLVDPEKSGVYRVEHEHDLLAATTGAPVDLAVVKLGDGKEAILAALSASLGFPEWFGGNWDALEDCLTDLSWRGQLARMIVLKGTVTGDDAGILIDVLCSSAEYWRDRGQPFIAVFVDPDDVLRLPFLYKAKAKGA
jgi:hypothetical protein